MVWQQWCISLTRCYVQAIQGILHFKTAELKDSFQSSLSVFLGVRTRYIFALCFSLGFVGGQKDDDKCASKMSPSMKTTIAHIWLGTEVDKLTTG